MGFSFQSWESHARAVRRDAAKGCRSGEGRVGDWIGIRAVGRVQNGNSSDKLQAQPLRSGQVQIDVDTSRPPGGPKGMITAGTAMAEDERVARSDSS